MRKKTIFAVCTFLFATSCVDAASMCDASERSELNREVVNIKGRYEEGTKVLEPGTYSVPDDVLGTEEENNYVAEYEYFKMFIYNLSEKFYVEVTNSVTNETKIFHYQDSKEGEVSFDWEGIGDIATFTVKVYASSSTSCEGELYRTFYVTTPRLNEYSQIGVCNQIKEVDEENYLCQKYVTYKPIDFGTFVERANRIIEDQAKGQQDEEEKKEGLIKKVGNFIGDHKTIFIVSGVTLIVIAGVVTAVVIRKRRSSDL